MKHGQLQTRIKGKRRRNTATHSYNLFDIYKKNYPIVLYSKNRILNI